MITDTVRQVVASLARNRLRTGLTVIGISIGIAAVICTAALGAGGSVRVERQIAALGDDFPALRRRGCSRRCFPRPLRHLTTCRQTRTAARGR
jgi:ABC-type antimicrobial peptide transport system permease subunit